MKATKEHLHQIYNFKVSSILSFVENFKICNSYIFQKKLEGITYVTILIRRN